MINNRYITLVLLSLLSSKSFAFSTVPESGNSSMYYEIGGGDSLPMPAFSTAETVSLDVGVGLNGGFNCNRFNPKVTLTNSLNNTREEIHNLQMTLMNSLQAGVANLPMYVLARANPTAYNLLNNAYLGAKDQFQIAAKDCYQMQLEQSQNKNPYQDWFSISQGNSWKKQIGVGGNKGGDMNVAAHKVAESKGDEGITWVAGKDAGGKGQAPIYVIKDTSIAGYNAMLDRKLDNKEPVIDGLVKNSPISMYWRSPLEAATWIVNVVGDHKVKTESKSKASDKGETPAKGLLPYNEEKTKQVLQNLTTLVQNRIPLLPEDLEQVSAPGVQVSAEIIRAIREMDNNARGIYVNKLAQEVAMSITIEKALLAKRILEAGRQIPEIRAVRPAQIDLYDAIQYLQQEIEDLIFNVNVRKQLVSNTATQILEHKRSREQLARSISAAGNPEDMLQHGGRIKERDK